jgi:hypothetical protein
MTHAISALVLCGSALLGALFVAPATAQQPPTVARILVEQPLWGRDYPALLAQLRALQESGETSAYVFSDRAAGASAFPTDQAAGARVERVRALSAKPVPLGPQFKAMQSAARTASLRAEAGRLIDGDGYHVVLNSPAGVELLPPGLTVTTVRARLGEPERVTELTIQNRGERRPVILKLHTYAGGAIAYAESNMAEPGVVERVVVNLAAVTPAVVR